MRLFILSLFAITLSSCGNNTENLGGPVDDETCQFSSAVSGAHTADVKYGLGQGCAGSMHQQTAVLSFGVTQSDLNLMLQISGVEDGVKRAGLSASLRVRKKSGESWWSSTCKVDLTRNENLGKSAQGTRIQFAGVGECPEALESETGGAALKVSPFQFRSIALSF